MQTVVLLASFVLASLASGARVTYPGLNAYQSSTLYAAGKYLGPEGALDRDKDNDFPNARLDKCTHTNQELNPWWAVDLQRPYSVYAVHIISRNGFENRLTNFTVGVSNNHPKQLAPVLGQYEVCRDYVGTPPAGLVKVACSHSLQLSRFVIIQLRTSELQFLELCEVEVYVTDYNILTRTMLTYQSSTFEVSGRPLYSFLAIDQNYNNSFPDPNEDTCTHTQSELHSWWAVDLDLSYNINYVTVYLRKEFTYRAAGAMVGVTNSSVLDVVPAAENLIVCGYLPGAGTRTTNPPVATRSTTPSATRSTTPSVTPLDHYTVGCRLNMPAARFMVIQLPVQNNLELCEVEVYGDHV